MSWQAGKRDDEISRKEIAADDSGRMTLRAKQDKQSED
jgi:hypothetical protein